MSEGATGGEQPAQDIRLGPCRWCGEPAATSVIETPGRKKRREVPVCESHAQQFEKQGIKTVRMEVDEMMERERKRGTWFKQHYKP